MSGLSILAALTTGVLPTPHLEFDGGTTCAEGARAVAVLEKHRADLPPSASVTMRVLTDESAGASRVEIFVTVDGETPVVERQAVNSCQEALAYLDFFLSLWTSEPQPVDVPRTPLPANTPASAAPKTTFTAAGFALVTTNHPNGVGAGAGVGLALGVDEVRVGAYGAWHQPSLLEGGPDVASFELQRTDFGASVCGETFALPVSLAPCLGASALLFGMNGGEAGPRADRHALIGSIDASLVGSVKLFAHTALESTLLLRYAPQALDLGSFRVGPFTPAQFEVNLRVGLTWDIPGLLSEQATKPLVGSSEPNSRRQAW